MYLCPECELSIVPDAHTLCASCNNTKEVETTADLYALGCEIHNQIRFELQNTDWNLADISYQIRELNQLCITYDI